MNIKYQVKFNDDHEGTLSYNSTLFANVTYIELVGSFVVDIAGYIGEKVKYILLLLY